MVFGHDTAPRAVYVAFGVEEDGCWHGDDAVSIDGLGRTGSDYGVSDAQFLEKGLAVAFALETRKGTNVQSQE